MRWDPVALRDPRDGTYVPYIPGHTDRDCDERLQVVGACAMDGCPCKCHESDEATDSLDAHRA